MSEPPVPPPRVGRFSATDLTFGPWGRVVATAVLLVPYWLALQTIMGFVLVVLWTPVFVMGVRQVWRRSDRLIDRRTASERGWTTSRPEDVPVVNTDWENPPPPRW